jgi:hypothetical protein
MASLGLRRGGGGLVASETQIFGIGKQTGNSRSPSIQGTFNCVTKHASCRPLSHIPGEPRINTSPCDRLKGPSTFYKFNAAVANFMEPRPFVRGRQSPNY